MVYNYLLELYTLLDERYDLLLKKQFKNVQGEDAATAEGHRQGQIQVNREFLQFLKSNYQHKLPKRLRKT
jgi:hypothetical protein